MSIYKDETYLRCFDIISRGHAQYLRVDMFLPHIIALAKDGFKFEIMETCHGKTVYFTGKRRK